MAAHASPTAGTTTTAPASGVLPREGTAADVRWFEVDPCYVFHPLNAYDDGDRVVLDVVRHPKHVRAPTTRARTRAPPTLWRWTVDLASGSVSEEQLDDRARSSRASTSGWSAGRTATATAATLDDGDGLGFDGSRVAQARPRDRDAPRRTTSGPAGRPARRCSCRPLADAAEDDGWVMSFVYDAADRPQRPRRSWPPRTSAASPVADVHLPARVPFGFHGNWVPTGQ